MDRHLGRLTTAAGALLIVLHGIPGRFSDRVVQLAAITQDSRTNDFRSGRCFLSTGYQFKDFDAAHCLTHVAGRPNVLIMGDSHAAHLWSGLRETYPQINFQQATASGCKPKVGSRMRGAARCTELMNYLFATYLPSAEIDAVILSGQWKDEDLVPVGMDLDWFRQHGIRVLLSGPVVRYRGALPELLAAAEHRQNPGLVDKARDSSIATLDRRFAALAQAHGSPYHSAYEALCRDRTCRTMDAAGMPVQFDNAHLTHGGSLIVAAQFPIISVTHR